MALSGALHILAGNRSLLLAASLPVAARALSTPPAPSDPAPSAPASPPPWADSALRAADILSSAESALFVTGAGISAESGLPTYRGVSGLYEGDGGLDAEGGMTIEECLSGSTYAADPSLTWRYLLQIERACRGAEPSSAHRLVAAAERHVRPGPVSVMTQNIDGLHGRAGSSDVLCLHGNVRRMRCEGGCRSTFGVGSYADFEAGGVFPPRCGRCGGPVRPDVVLFDEYLGDDTVRRYEEMLGVSMRSLFRSRPEEARYDVSVCIGTSALFQYVVAAALSGRAKIEINPTRTPLSGLVDVRIPAGATDALQFIYDELGWEA